MIINPWPTCREFDATVLKLNIKVKVKMLTPWATLWPTAIMFVKMKYYILKLWWKSFRDNL